MSYIGLNTIRDFALLIDVSVVTHPACPQTSVDAHHQLVSVEAHSTVASLTASFDYSRLNAKEPPWCF
jgi:phage head maturation protease